MIAACIFLGMYMFSDLKNVRALVISCIFVGSLIYFVDKETHKKQPVKIEQHPDFVKVLGILDFVHAYNHGDFEIFIQDVRGFLRQYNKIVKADNKKDVEHFVDILEDMRRDLLNKVNYLKLSVPVCYGDTCDKALRMLQACTYGLIEKVKRSKKITSKMFPISKDSFENQIDYF